MTFSVVFCCETLVHQFTGAAEPLTGTRLRRHPGRRVDLYAGWSGKCEMQQFSQTDDVRVWEDLRCVHVLR